MTIAPGAEPQARQRSFNPYVGPRPFQPDETLYGRDREKRELTNLLIAQRIVLLHAPSGAGKTSLIQAGVAPRLLDEGFAPTPALRVKTRAPNNRAVRNHYVYSVAYYLLGNERSTKELAKMQFKDIIEAAAERAPEETPVLVLDQFEDILILDPTDHVNQREFFRQLGDALDRTGAWALFSIREDFMGGLERYARYVPGHLAARFRLDYLERDAARVAIQKPAQENDVENVEFPDRAARRLVERLATMKVQRPGEREDVVPTPYVHPFQLQVVCQNLWRTVRKQHEAEKRPFESIKLRDVNRADIKGAMRNYYRGVVQAVARKTGADEGDIRDWFQRELITPQRYRRQTITGPSSRDVDPALVARELERLYLVRSDTRIESTWYELSHDRLVDAVIADNEAWRLPRLAPWRVAAREWLRTKDPDQLLRGWDLEAARRADQAELLDGEREFIRESEQAEHQGVIGRMQRSLGMTYRLVILEFVVIVVLAALLFFNS
jgi:hypothetical protein